MSIEGSVRADAESFKQLADMLLLMVQVKVLGVDGGIILLFLYTLELGDSAVLPSVEGHGDSNGGGGGG